MAKRGKDRIAGLECGLGAGGRRQGRSDGAKSGWHRVTEPSAPLWLQGGVAPGGGTPICPRVLQRLGAPGR